MKIQVPHILKQAPGEGWMRVRVEYPVHIPNPEGNVFSEGIEVEVDAWRNPSGEIVFEGRMKEKLEAVRARYADLRPSVAFYPKMPVPVRPPEPAEPGRETRSHRAENP